MNRENLLVWIVQTFSFHCLRLDSDYFSLVHGYLGLPPPTRFLLASPSLRQVVHFCRTDRSTHRREHVHLATPVQTGLATNSRRSPREEMSRVLSQAESVQGLRGTDSCGEHTKQFDQALHFVAGVQEFELARSSFLSNLVQLFLSFRNARFRLRSSCRILRWARGCKLILAVCVLMLKFCSIVM